MVDYTKATGTHGTLILRDNGSVVQAIIKNAQSATFAYGKAWSVNSSSGTFSISGVQEVVVWSATISTTTTLTFTMGATGTSGLAGPTTLTQTIARATVPGVPNIQPITNIGPQGFQINFTAPASNGGSAILDYQYRLAKVNPPTGTPVTTTVGANPVTGLDPGELYYAQVRARNAVGFSAWSSSVSARTLGPVRVKVDGVWKFAIPYVKDAGVWKMAQPFVKDAGVWKKTG